MNDQLSWQRLAWVLRVDVMRSGRSALVILGTAAGVALGVSLGGAYDGDVGQGPTFYRAFFIAALFAWGTIATSGSGGSRMSTDASASAGTQFDWRRSPARSAVTLSETTSPSVSCPASIG